VCPVQWDGRKTARPCDSVCGGLPKHGTVYDAPWADQTLQTSYGEQKQSSSAAGGRIIGC
jgi:hypothetical protein